MVVGQLVFDLSGFWKTHPGGAIINKYLGSDGTRAYNQHHPWVNAGRYMPERVVGVYVPNSVNSASPDYPDALVL